MDSREDDILGLASSGLLPKEVAELLLSMHDELVAARTAIREKDEEIDGLKEFIREQLLLRKLANSEKYDPSSEQLLLDLFPEAEAIAALEDDGETVAVKAHARRRRPRKKTCTAPADAPVVDVFHGGDATDSMTRDGISYRRIEDRVVFKAAVIPARVVVEKHHYPQYGAVETEDGETNRIVLWENRETDSLGAGASFIADVVVKKFDDHLPLFRQEEMLRRDGLYFSRQKMAGWLIKSYEMLIPFMDVLKKEVYGCNLLNKDETRLQVLDVKNKSGKPSKNSFMNVTVGTTYLPEERTYRKLVIYDCSFDRKIETLMDDCRRFGYHGHVMTDGLKGYLRMAPSRHATCWVHAIRAFKKLYKVDRANDHLKQMISLFGKLYKIEDEERAKLEQGDSTVEGFLSSRKQRASKVIDDIYKYAGAIRGFYPERSSMGNAISYLDTYRDNLRTYLDVVEATPDNNVAENAIRPFAVGRKNWLFAKSVDGADASAAFFSLVETAKLSNVPVREYIEFVLTEAPRCKSEQQWRRLLPWNADLGLVRSRMDARMNAKPDGGRTGEYIFAGASR